MPQFFSSLLRQALTICVLGFSICAHATYFNGELDITIADDFKHNQSEIYYKLKSNHQVYNLKLPSKIDTSDLLSGDRVSIEGNTVEYLADNQKIIAVDAIKVISKARSSQVEPVSHTAAVFRVSFLDSENTEAEDTLVHKIFTANNSARQFYLISSFGKVNFISDANGDGNPDVFNINLDENIGDTCRPGPWAKAVREKAKASGIDLSLYRHLMYVLPRGAKCKWAGLGTLGCGKQCHSWYKSRYTKVYAHEWGHNLGLPHASSDFNNDGTVDKEYGDTTTAMGRSYRQINAPQRYETVKWYTPYSEMVREMTTSGRVTINSLDKHPVNVKNGVQVVKISKEGVDRPYYLSYRTNIGVFGMGENNMKRVSVHRMKNGTQGKSLLLGVIGRGESFVSPIDGLKFQVLKNNDNTAKVKVYFRNRCGFQKNPCSLLANEAVNALDGNHNFFVLDVPANTPLLTIESSATGDTAQTALIARYGEVPTTKKFDCKSDVASNHQLCELINPAAGKWYIELASKKAHQGLSLKATV